MVKALGRPIVQTLYNLGVEQWMVRFGIQDPTGVCAK